MDRRTAPRATPSCDPVAALASSSWFCRETTTSRPESHPHFQLPLCVCPPRWTGSLRRSLVMPLLSPRRSVLWDLSTNSSDQQQQQPNWPPAASTKSGATLRPHSPLTQRPRSEHGLPTSRLSHELLADDIDGASLAPSHARSIRFSLMKFRNLSESQLSVRAKEHAAHDDAPPMPVPHRPTPSSLPSIVKTAPTMDDVGAPAGPSEEEEQRDETAPRHVRPSFFQRSHSRARPAATEKPARKSTEEKRKEKGRSSLRWRKLQGKGNGLEDLHRLSALHMAGQQAQQAAPPPSYGDETHSDLALPVPPPRFSESSQSDGSNASSGDHIYGSTTTTTTTHTTFFKLPRRHNKNRNSLFPLPARVASPDAPSTDPNEPTTPRASTSAFSTHSVRTPDGPDDLATPPTVLQRRHTDASSPTKHREPRPALPSPHAAPGKSLLSFAEPDSHLFRDDSRRSRGSSASSPLQPPSRFSTRDRASTASSLGRPSNDQDTPPLMTGSTRNSTSTASRASLHGLLHLARFRQGSEPQSPRHGSPGSRSKSNSFAQSRETLVIPEREEGDSPSRYLERLEAAVARSVIAGILSKSADPFAQAVLRSYTRRFPFFGEPIDMSLRKFLLEAELPKETQQVDRVIQAFADRYHECNPGIFVSSDQAYIIAFSLMMLHTDAFNKNNKRKMQKHDYVKNTSGQQVADDVLACFYDNICYTPFVHYEEEMDVNGERILPFKVKKSKVKGLVSDGVTKKPSGPLDPYNLLVESKLDLLRPPIKDHIALDDPYNYLGDQGELDPHYLQRAFTHTGVLQIISARSRPAAYEGTIDHASPSPVETQAGIVDLKITKVGIVWRKAAKKKKARSPWQEWGAVLTGSQLYLFKNAHWAKSLAHQFNSQQRPGQPRIPVIFKPPLQDFKPDALVKTDNAVALVDATYNRHKHAFMFFRAGGQEEVMLAENEGELNDWLALINYAAAFRAAGVRIRGMVGGNEEDLRAGQARLTDAADASAEAKPVMARQSTVARGGLSPQLQQQVMAARRQIMVQKIGEIEQAVGDAVMQLDTMLRNARHLLVLAPIGQKTREDVMHAAAKSDAMVKWLRRDIWRLKCHRDILVMDVRLDGYSASELRVLAEQQAISAQQAIKDVEHQRAEHPNDSSAGERHSRPAQTPPHSPSSPARSDRRSTTESIETLMSNDLFRTPPGTVDSQTRTDGYKLPPLQLDVDADNEHRPSITSTLLSVSSPARRSLSQASSASSYRPIPLERVDSEVVSDVSRPEDPTSATDPNDRKVELLARSTMTPPPVASAMSRGNMSLDGVSSASTPESTKHKGVRRSLQKTLRDGHHHGSSSVHRHRRGKDSDGTIRAAGVDAENADEGTPRLEREKGRFILHGKQASVIQFGSDWPNERMKARRGQWQQQHGGPAHSPTRQYSHASDLTTTSSTAAAAGGSMIQTFLHDPSGDESGGGGDAAGSSSSARYSYSLRSDAEAAEAFASSTRGLDGAGGEAASYFDVESWDPSYRDPIDRDVAKRQTVIGPTPVGGDAAPSREAAERDDAPDVRDTPDQANHDNDDDDDDHEDADEGDSDSVASKSNRRTVIGPPRVKSTGAGAAPADDEGVQTA
nr:protein transport protein sec73 [Quercus suber]